MPSPHITHPLDIDLITKRRDLSRTVGDKIAHPAEDIPQDVVGDRFPELSEVGDDDGHFVAVGHDVFVGEVAIFDEVVTFPAEGDFEDDGEGEAQAFEHVIGWDSGAEVVEGEGCRGSFDRVGDHTLGGDQGGVRKARQVSGTGGPL